MARAACRMSRGLALSLQLTARRLTLELTRRPTRATSQIEPANEHERQAKGGRVE
jgi:hypothetical protein